MAYSISSGEGLIAPARFCASPNHDERPAGVTPELIVLHGISLPPGEFGGDAIERLFTNRLDWGEHAYYAEIRGLRVSAHMLLRRDGELIQFVPLTQRAWHCGTSSFRGRDQCNDFSVGIELEGSDDIAYTDTQYTQLTDIILAMTNTYPALDARHLAGHCDVAPGRKTDPGPAFDWLRLYDALAEDRQATLSK